ncbi:Myb/SANT-like DNA-binding domain [Popillia japonica]|uniref:Myb/SANT-like DNA-binding domain n=1 Tax=Popillia japonica TaxID=7064 RepID=A0AAW1JEX3_POPJA
MLKAIGPTWKTLADGLSTSFVSVDELIKGWIKATNAISVRRLLHTMKRIQATLLGSIFFDYFKCQWYSVLAHLYCIAFYPIRRDSSFDPYLGHTVYDPINDKTHRLLVTKEDYNRAHSDPTFAQSLLSHAIECDGEKENRTEENNNRDKFDDNISPKENKQHLSHPVKRKHVFENVSNDLLSLGCSIDATTCNTKWKTLVRSYKNTKDNNTKTGQSSSRLLFFEKMDEILGNKPSISCLHTLAPSSLGDSNLVIKEDSTNNFDDSMQSSSTNESIVEVEESINEGQNVPTNNINANNEAHKKKEKLSKKRSINDIYQLKQEEYNKRQKRHEERMKIQQETLELYKKKVNVLEKLQEKYNL